MKWTVDIKKVVAWFSLLILLISCLGVARADGQEWGYSVMYVNNPNPADRLHLRAEPRQSAVSRGKYYNGVYVTVLGYSSNDRSWAYVRVDDTGLTGYMDARYLSSTPVRSAMPSVTVRSGSSGLSLRESPSSASASRGTYSNGTIVTVLGVLSSWRHVRVNGQTGYMPASSLSESGAPTGGTTGGETDDSPDAWWQGPVGYHRVAAWNIPMSGSVATVRNPDPADRLHLRVRASQSSASLGKYYNGVRVSVLGETGGEWVKVAIGSLTGYMKSEFLAVSGGIGTGAVVSAMPIMTVSNPNSVGNLHLRARATTASASLGLYPNGTEVVLMGFSAQWAHVIVDGQMGFMLAKFLQ